MSTSRPTLAAVHRDVTGKAVGRLRRDGRLPGVVYGRGIESMNVSVDTQELDALRRHAGPNTLIDLSVDGKKARPVLVQGVQTDRVRGRPLHVDLFVVRMTEEMVVDVPLVPIGTSPAVALQGGTLLHVTEHVKVRALPDHLPQSIEYSIESLVDFEATVHLRDLTIPSDVALLSDPDEIVAKVLAPRVEEEPVTAAAEPEGEAAEAGEGDDSSAEGGASGDSSGA